MSVGGVGSSANVAALQSALKPESMEKSGAPDHDGDSDDHKVQPSVAQPTTNTLGQSIGGTISTVA